MFIHFLLCHYGDVIMGAIASQITSLTIVYSAIYSDADQRKHQSSALLAFVWGICRWIPTTNGQQRGKCFHLMTSSCITNPQCHTGTDANGLFMSSFGRIFPTVLVLLYHYILVIAFGSHLDVCNFEKKPTYLCNNYKQLPSSPISNSLKLQ